MFLLHSQNQKVYLFRKVSSENPSLLHDVINILDVDIVEMYFKAFACVLQGGHV